MTLIRRTVGYLTAAIVMLWLAHEFLLSNARP